MSDIITQNADSTKKTRKSGGRNDDVRFHYSGLTEALTFPALVFARILYEEHKYGYQKLTTEAAKRGYKVSRSAIRQQFPKSKQKGSK